MRKNRPYLTTTAPIPQKPEDFAGDECSSLKLVEQCNAFAKDRLQDLNAEPAEDRKGKLLKLRHKDSPAKKLLRCIQSNKYADAIVTVEGHSFMCHSVVLRMYSRAFAKSEELGKSAITVGAPQLTSKGFSQVYKWMVSNSSKMPVLDLVELLRAAYYLDVPELLERCWTVLDSPLFNEFSSFSLMYEGRRAHELFELQELMAGRISRATMTIMSSREFLCLSERQVCSFIKSSSLSVNSEMEMLYGALLWLSHLWPDRRSSTPNVLKNLRFGYLSPTMLSKFKALQRQKIGPFSEILNEFSRYPGITQLIQDAMFHSSLVITSYNDPKTFRENMEFNQLKPVAPRRWICDQNCNYHRAVGNTCPNMRFISFQKFKNYLFKLQRCESDFDKNMEFGKDDNAENTISELKDSRNFENSMLFSAVNVEYLSEYIKLMMGNTGNKWPKSTLYKNAEKRLSSIIHDQSNIP